MNHEKRKVTLYSSQDGALIAKKQDRNARCTCGSGKKAKSCCGCETKYFKPKKPQTDAPKKDLDELKREMELRVKQKDLNIRHASPFQDV